MRSRPAASDRSWLLRYLMWARIAGEVATPRENNLQHLRALSEGDTYYHFGLDLGKRWQNEDDVLELMADRCGISDDREHTEGQDTIDPELTVAALERAAKRLKRAAAGRQRVLLATGHPAGLLAVHQALARSLRLAGCELALPPDGLVDAEGEIRHLDGVMVLHRGGNLMHTHSPAPMRRVLDALERDSQTPDLVHADHGWAGCAGQRGLDTVGYADCNDPGLFIGEAEGRLLATVPLDDNVPPHRYQPMVDYLLRTAELPPAEAGARPAHNDGGALRRGRRGPAKRA